MQTSQFEKQKSTTNFQIKIVNVNLPRKKALSWNETKSCTLLLTKVKIKI